MKCYWCKDQQPDTLNRQLSCCRDGGENLHECMTMNFQRLRKLTNTTSAKTKHFQSAAAITFLSFIIIFFEAYLAHSAGMERNFISPFNRDMQITKDTHRYQTGNESETNEVRNGINPYHNQYLLFAFDDSKEYAKYFSTFQEKTITHKAVRNDTPQANISATKQRQEKPTYHDNNQQQKITTKRVKFIP